MKRKIMIIGMAFVLIIESVFIYNLFKPSKSLIFENVKEINVFKEKNKTLSIMVQDGIDEEGNPDYSWHEAIDRNKWPDYSEYTYAGTECEDASGTKIDSKPYIQFDEKSNMATITTKKTIYCTLYFAKGRPTLEVLNKHKTGGQETTTFTETDVDGMYRYNGTALQVTNNYICFGTTNTDTCTATGANNRDKYLYRIIGITDSNVNTELELEEGQLKIIRAIPSNTQQNWGSTERDKNLWDKSAAKTYLNGTFLNTIDVEWKTLIDNPLWWIGETGSGGEESTKSGNIQIGLMYQRDYYDAGNGTPETNWLHITNGRSDVATTYKDTKEWTMTKYGSYSVYGYQDAVYISEYGNTQYNENVLASFAVRPVFYLLTGISLIGNGTEDRPFIITSGPIS